MAISGANPSIRLTFLGAARTVTGSKYLLEVEDKKVLFDCGLFQGKKELRLRNWDIPKFDPKGLTAIVLTHAHIDHTGYLPLVVKQGYKGPIYCNPATAALLRLLLPDTAHLQEEEARYANMKGSTRHKPAKPLYDHEDAENTLRQLKMLNTKGVTEVAPGVKVSSCLAGHILGATSLTVDVLGKRINFSGDIGRYDVPVLPDPNPMDLGDLLLCESTYGDREHDKANTEAELARVIKGAIDKKGPLIIPAFAVGRAQDLLYHIAELERRGTIPVLPVYVDSPMAVDATQIYQQYRNDYDQEALKQVEGGRLLFHTERTEFCRTVNQSKELNYLKGPRIIISASGMVTGGRILHHMSNHLGDENCTVLFVGFQAEGTRGRTIQSGAEDVKIFGQYIPIRATVETISSLSAHGDRTELTRWLKSCSGTPKQVMIVHGEEQPSTNFAAHVRKELGWNARPAEYLETVEV